MLWRQAAPTRSSPALRSAAKGRKLHRGRDLLGNDWQSTKDLVIYVRAFQKELAFAVRSPLCVLLGVLGTGIPYLERGVRLV